MMVKNNPNSFLKKGWGQTNHLLWKDDASKGLEDFLPKPSPR